MWSQLKVDPSLKFKVELQWYFKKSKSREVLVYHIVISYCHKCDLIIMLISGSVNIQEESNLFLDQNLLLSNWRCEIVIYFA